MRFFSRQGVGILVYKRFCQSKTRTECYTLSSIYRSLYSMKCILQGLNCDQTEQHRLLSKKVQLLSLLKRYDINGRFQMQGGKNWIFPKEMNANRFFWDSHWLEIWSNHFCPSIGPNGGSVAMDSARSKKIWGGQLFMSSFFQKSAV
jgi:hypothetical protein